jgi:hypothetical protein
MGYSSATLLEVTVNNESNDPYWKELADYLRKLNVDFYWKTQSMVHDKSAYQPKPPPRPFKGGGISMTMRQEHTPPVLTEDEEPVSSQKSENRDRKRNSPERGF